MGSLRKCSNDHGIRTTTRAPRQDRQLRSGRPGCPDGGPVPGRAGFSGAGGQPLSDRLPDRRAQRSGGGGRLSRARHVVDAACRHRGHRPRRHGPLHRNEPEHRRWTGSVGSRDRRRGPPAGRPGPRGDVPAAADSGGPFAPVASRSHQRGDGHGRAVHRLAADLRSRPAAGPVRRAGRGQERAAGADLPLHVGRRRRGGADRRTRPRGA